MQFKQLEFLSTLNLFINKVWLEGKNDKDIQSQNIFSLLEIFEVSHFDILGKLEIDEHL